MKSSRTLAPMQVTTASEMPSGDWWYEIKYDGIRAIITVQDSRSRIYSRNLNDITSRFPELHVPAAFTTECVVDGEIIWVKSDGRHDFHAVVSRMNSKGRVRPSPSVQCVLFDCLEVEGVDLTGKPLEARREALERTVNPGGPYKVSKVYDDGEALYEAATKLGLEGIVAKRRGSRYVPGRYSKDWLRVTVQQTADCRVIGYTPGEGRRKNSVGSLRLAENVDDSWTYRGKVGTGLKDKEWKTLYRGFQSAPPLTLAVKNLPKRKDVLWVDTGRMCEVSYREVTKNGTFRHPTFQRWRPDLE